jgi:hypothetical protein
MKIQDWSKKILWFVLGAVTIGSMSFISASHAQNQFVKLVMRIGEERVLDDGLKVGISKGDGDFIIVTLSRNASTPSSSASISPTKLRLGTYKARGVLETITSGDGSGMQYTMPLKIKIGSINNDNNVEAEFIRNGQIGRIKGRIDATGKLQLEGYLAQFGAEWHVFLTATVENHILTNGKYTMKSSIEVNGVFPTSELEDDN